MRAWQAIYPGQKMSYRFHYQDAYFAVVAQLAVLLGFFPFVWLAWHLKEASSFILGGLVCFLPNVYFYRCVFKGPQSAKKIIKAFYFGEMVKLISTGAGFFLALQITQVQPEWLFVGYIAAHGGFRLGPVINGYRKMHNMKRALIG